MDVAVFQDQLIQLLGQDNCLADAAAMGPYLTDWSGTHTGEAIAVVFPTNTEQVSTLVRLCQQNQIAMVPQGGNTCSTQAAVPHGPAPQVVISLKKLNQVLDVDPVGNTISVQAGCTLRAVQEAAQKAGRLFPLSLPSEETCLIGGNLATNAGGTAVLRYGNIRALTLGLEVVLPNGDVWHNLKQLRKDNAGYDLKQMFIGAEGTLGIITAASLRLFPATPNRAAALVAVESLDSAIALYSALQTDMGNTFTAFEFMTRSGANLAISQHPELASLTPSLGDITLLLETATPRAATRLQDRLQEALTLQQKQGRLTAFHMANNDDEIKLFWRLRNGLPLGIDQDGGSVMAGCIKHDVSVPLSKIPAFVAEASRQLEKLEPLLRILPFGHVGDGNIHFNLLPPPGMSATAFLAQRQKYNDCVYGLAQDMGGSFAAEHGIGAAKAQRLITHSDKVTISLMKSLKTTLDPHGLMNPGKVLP